MDTPAEVAYLLGRSQGHAAMGEGRTMKENQWLACEAPEDMLFALYSKASERKLGLFAAACHRRVWARRKDEGPRRAAEEAERLADGEAATMGRAAVHFAVDATDLPSTADLFAAEYPAWGAAHRASLRAGAMARPEAKAQADLLRCIFGSPFRPVTATLVRQTPEAVALALAAYEQRDLPGGALDTTRLAVLADALEDSGCDQADLLAHLRGPGPHVRGCWAVDLLLGKS